VARKNEWTCKYCKGVTTTTNYEDLCDSECPICNIGTVYLSASFLRKGEKPIEYTCAICDESFESETHCPFCYSNEFYKTATQLIKNKRKP
jgi:hypothetical protein